MRGFYMIKKRGSPEMLLRISARTRAPKQSPGLFLLLCNCPFRTSHNELEKQRRYFYRFVIRFLTQTQNHGIAVDIINSAGIAYHQHEVLYIIKPQIDAR